MSDTYVSLFAGIGGLDLAAEAFGYECVGQVEWDAACTRVLERWWPDVPRWGDVRGFTAAAYADRRRRDGGAEPDELAARRLEAPRRRDADRRDVGTDGPSLIVGGFPCQPVSTAGRRKGQADDRWLWPEFARVVGELRPRHVLVENVPGLLTVNGGRAFSEVIGTLADLGYDATWRSLRAADIGAPHRRERVFILATYGDGDGCVGERSTSASGPGVGERTWLDTGPAGPLDQQEARMKPSAQHGLFPDTFRIDWATPQWLFDELHAEFGFEVDVCADASNAKCDTFYTKEQNGLAQVWAPRVCWMNPPLWSRDRDVGSQGPFRGGTGRNCRGTGAGADRHSLVARLLHRPRGPVPSRSAEVRDRAE